MSKRATIPSGKDEAVPIRPALDPTLEIPLTDLCAALCAELAGTARLSLAVQDVVSHLLRTARFDPQDARQLQSLDRLSQVLDDLAAVVRVLPEAWTTATPNAPAMPRDRIRTTVRLRDVAAALLGETILPCAHVSDSFTTGQVDWL